VGAIAAAIGLGGFSGTDAAACREGGVSCTGDAQCCSGECGEPSRRGRRTCTCPGERVMCGLRCCDEGLDCVNGECRDVSVRCGNGGACLVFVSHAFYTGNLGGVAGADAKCQAAAGDAGWPGTFRAWISDDFSSPSIRFDRSPGPYVRTDGRRVALNWNHLTEANFFNAISLNEAAGQVFSDVWTATTTDGKQNPNSTTPCRNWTSTGGLIAYVGESNQTGEGWTGADKFHDCFETFPLYCFQQSGASPED
jgi:hypothetical protein